MYRLLKIVPNTFESESRDLRELNIARELGFEVMVMAKCNEDKNGVKDRVDGFDVYRFSTRPLGNKAFIIKLNRVISLFTWAYGVRKFNPDVISCHDILALAIGNISNMCRSKGKRALLIYDSHEFEMGRNVRRTKFKKLLIKHIEGYLIKRSFKAVMVNDIIADEIKKLYKLPQRPVVVRNIPNKWVLIKDEIDKKREEYLRRFNRDKPPFIVMYHGRIANGRGIENMIMALNQTADTVGIIIGNGESQYIERLKGLAIKLNVAERVIFEPAIPYQELWKHLASADAGLVVIENICKSYFYSLPNKYFENIQSLTPIINSNFPAMDQLAQKYNIGISTDCSDPIKISQSIEKLKNDKELYSNIKQNLILAKEELCWENERRVLITMYEEIITKLENKN